MKHTTGLIQNEQFLIQSLRKSLPFAMLATLGATVNVFFDGVIVGQKLGADGFTAINLCMPVYLLICTLGSLIGSGGAIMSSHAIGKGDFKRGGRIYSTAVVMVLLISLLFTVAGLLFVDNISRFLAGTGSLYNDVRSYSFFTIAGALPGMYMYIPLHYLRLDGKNFWVAASAVSMTVVNLLLDYLFLFVMDWGIGSTALAGAAGSLFACVISTIALSGSHNFNLSINFDCIKEVSGIIKSGSPAALYNLMSALRILCINSILLRTCGGEYVSVFSILNNISEFSLFFVNGIPQAAAPIVGVYSSEHSNDGLKILIKYQIKMQFIIAVIFSAVIVVFANKLSLLFGVNRTMYLPAFCLATAIVIGGVNSILTSYYGNSKKTNIANTLTVSKVLLFSVLTLMAVLKSNLYVWLFLPATELCTMVLIAVLLCIIHRKKSGLSPILLLDYRWQQEGHILDFSVNASHEAICDASEKITEFCSINNLTPKQTMHLELAIEEILTLMTDRCFEQTQNKTFDLRAFYMDDSTGIRIRCLGRQFNPFADNDDSPDEQFLGIRIIRSVAKSIEYQHILGANCIMLII